MRSEAQHASIIIALYWPAEAAVELDTRQWRLVEAVLRTGFMLDGFGLEKVLVAVESVRGIKLQIQIC